MRMKGECSRLDPTDDPQNWITELSDLTVGFDNDWEGSQRENLSPQIKMSISQELLI